MAGTWRNSPGKQSYYRRGACCKLKSDSDRNRPKKLTFFRIMRPGTIHYVVTIEDSFLIGGHFYSSATYSATLRSIVWEHFYGTSITNSVEERSLIILIKSLFQLITEQQDWLPSDDRAADSNMERKIASQHISFEELSALAVLNLYIDKLPPETRDGEEASASDETDGRWRNTSDFRGDFHWGKMLSYEFFRNCSGEQQAVLIETQNNFVDLVEFLTKKTRTVMPGIHSRNFNTVMATWEAEDFAVQNVQTFQE